MGNLFEKSHIHNAVFGCASSAQLTFWLVTSDGKWVHYEADYTVTSDGITGLALVNALAPNFADQITGMVVLAADATWYVNFSGLVTDGDEDTDFTVPDATNSMSILAGSYVTSPVEVGRIA